MRAKICACVIGGGTAGCMAAAHISKIFPNVDLTHIYDSRIPSIGVGEGTTPPFRNWIHDTTGLTFDELRDSALITRKDGIRFEDWGPKHPAYNHLFSTLEGHAYHISAQKIVDVLHSQIEAERVDRKIVDVRSDTRQTIVAFENGEERVFDLVIDARGLPKELEREHYAFANIPTNAALLRQGPHRPTQFVTRAVARPHGWIFSIPLTAHTSYGYIFNSGLSDAAQVEADFDEFMGQHDIAPTKSSRQLQFPSFMRRSIFDGSLFHIGNSASFLEPLEATAITIVLFQLRQVSAWLITRLTDWGDDNCAAILDAQAVEFIEQVSWFVAWHYARGSTHDTPFWQFARKLFEEQCVICGDRPAYQQFQQFVSMGKSLDPALSLVADRGQFDGIEPVPDPDITCGGFLVDSFAKVGHGMAYFAKA